MGAVDRKGKIHRLDPAARALIERMLDEDRWTLDEIVHAVKLEFPGADFSRSGIDRYKPEYEEMRTRMKSVQRLSDALVEGLGEGASDKAGRLLAQAVTTAVTHAALRVQTRDDNGDDAVDIGELNVLALAAGRALKAQRLATDESLIQERERKARESLLKEQNERLDSQARAQGMDEEQVLFWRREVLGVK